MSVEKVDLNWEEILSGASTGIVREVESLRQNIQWGHGAKFDRYQKWGKSVSGTLCEMALAKKMKSYFSHSVNLSLLGSDKTIFLLPFILDKIKPHNNPIAPPP